MAETDNDSNDGVLRQVGIFPLLVGILGGGALLAGLVVLGVGIYNPTMRDKIDTVREIAIVPALFIVGGLLLLGTFLLLKEMRSLEKKMGALTEQAFDREVAALLAALRPFAERLEERIGPVLTASQKLQKPLDTVHSDLQQQGQQIQDLTNGFEELKMLLNRTRDDLSSMGKGSKAIEPLQKQIEELGSALKNQAAPKIDLQPIQGKIQGLEKQLQDLGVELKALREKKIEFPRIDFPKVEIPSYEPLQRSMEESIAAIRDRVESLAQMLAQMPSPAAPASDALAGSQSEAFGSLHKEIAASREIVERCLSTAQTAAEAAQRAASAAEQASNRADRVEQTLRSMPAAPSAPAASAPSAPEAAPPASRPPENLPSIKPPAEPAAAAPQEKRSIKDAIAKLKMLRGGPG